MDGATQRLKLFLHIGYPKTGTTALQTCFVNNQRFLFENKICYSRYLNETLNHVNLGASIVYEYLTTHFGAVETSPWEWRSLCTVEPPADIVDRMMCDFHQNGCDTLILSSEYFVLSAYKMFTVPGVNADNTPQGHLHRKEHVKQYLKNVFREFETKIVCYIRRQDDSFESSYQQRCKGVHNLESYQRDFERAGPAQTADSQSGIFLSPMPQTLKKSLELLYRQRDYHAVLSDWAAVFGKENIIVRPYEKSQLPHGVEYDFFVNVLGKAPAFVERLMIPGRTNESINKEVLEFKMQARLFDFHREFVKLAQSPDLPQFVKDNGRKNILTAGQAEQVRERFAPCNEKIAREYLGREDGVLFYDPPRDPKDDYPGLSLDAALAISKELALMLKNEAAMVNQGLNSGKNLLVFCKNQLDLCKNPFIRRITKPLRGILRLLFR